MAWTGRGSVCKAATTGNSLLTVHQTSTVQANQCLRLNIAYTFPPPTWTASHSHHRGGNKMKLNKKEGSGMEEQRGLGGDAARERDKRKWALKRPFSTSFRESY